MKVLLSSIGTRGDVQPILALARELRAQGHDATFCVAPNFREWVQSFGFACVPIGPDLRALASSGKWPSAEEMRALAAQSVRDQFRIIEDAARGHDVVVAANALQIATRSVTQLLGIHYVFAAYAPVSFPSLEHAPAKTRPTRDASTSSDPATQWQAEGQRWSDLFLSTLNEERSRRGLPPSEDIMRHIFTGELWLATDPALAPAPSGSESRVVQTGAWFLQDDTALPAPLERFLDEGEAPIYFGFGSMHNADKVASMLLDTARALGRRAVFSEGWGNLVAKDAGNDCICIGDVNHAALFKRVAIIVHHGGAGTTHAAARAGCPQVIVPHMYDQYYWAKRVHELGIGIEGPTRDQLTAQSLIDALRAVHPEIVRSAQLFAQRVEQKGTAIAVRQLSERFGS